MTFLAAAPVAIFLILVSDRYAQKPGLKLGLAPALLGMLLLLSHGLVFVFGIAVSGTVYAVERWPLRGGARRFLAEGWPFFVPILACAAYFVISRRLETQYGGVSNVGPLL